MSLTEFAKENALSLGFDLVGITDASPLGPEHTECLRRWVAEGKAAGMSYMYRNIERRFDPTALLTGARSVICVAVSYKLPANPSAPIGKIAEYATFKDYHVFMKERLFALADLLRIEAGGEPSFKVCVDSSRIAERALAMRAGLGFIGRNCMLINHRLGPAMLLGELMTDLEMVADVPGSGSCGSCTACIEACPTGALADGSLDARKCLSYLTVEHKGPMPRECAVKAGGRLFGCDECVHACPFYAKAPCCSDGTLGLRTGAESFRPAEVLEWDEQTFRNKTAGTPVERPGLQGLKRNAAICIDNSRQR